MEVLKQENMENTNRARLIRPCVVAGFAVGFIGGACTGFLAGSIMFLQGNIVKVFVKIKVLKSQGVKCKCTYGVTIPREYLQVARWWQRWCLRIRCSWSSFWPGTTAPTCVHYRLHCRLASVSLQRKPCKCIHTWVHMQHQL